MLCWRSTTLLHRTHFTSRAFTERLDGFTRGMQDRVRVRESRVFQETNSRTTTLCLSDPACSSAFVMVFLWLLFIYLFLNGFCYGHKPSRLVPCAVDCLFLVFMQNQVRRRSAPVGALPVAACHFPIGVLNPVLRPQLSLQPTGKPTACTNHETSPYLTPHCPFGRLNDWTVTLVNVFQLFSFKWPRASMSSFWLSAGLRSFRV